MPADWLSLSDQSVDFSKLMMFPAIVSCSIGELLSGLTSTPALTGTSRPTTRSQLLRSMLTVLPVIETLQRAGLVVFAPKKYDHSWMPTVTPVMEFAVTITLLDA